MQLLELLQASHPVVQLAQKVPEGKVLVGQVIKH